jgi:hypothetical protein
MTAAMNGTTGALPPAAIVGALIEDSFTHVKPPDATFTLTRNITDDHLYHLAEFYNQRLYCIHDNRAGLSVPEHNKLVAQAHRDWENERFKIESSEADVMHQLVSAVTHYDRLKKAHAETQCKCLKLFKEFLGPAPKSLIRSELLNGQYRAAYLTLYMHYNTGVGGVQSAINLIQMVQSVAWEPQRMSVLEHVEKMDTLIALANNQGAGINDNTRTAYINGSLQKGNCKTYEKDLEEAKRGNRTLQWLFQRLARTATNEAMRAKKSNKRNSYEFYNPDSDAEFVGYSHASTASSLSSGGAFDFKRLRHEIHAAIEERLSPGSFSSESCAKCGKKGDDAGSCWSDKTCTKCGIMGHIAGFCCTGKAKSVKFQQKAQK